MNEMDTTPDRRFSHAEAAEVIRRATELQHRREDTLTYDQLVEVASEVGIDRATVDATIRQAQDEEKLRPLPQQRGGLFDRCLELLCLKPPAPRG